MSGPVTILVDADACPVKDEIYKVAWRHEVAVKVVSNSRLRVPEHPVCQGLLEQIGEPLLATTLILPDHDDPLNDAEEIREALDKRIQAIVDAGACAMTPTTVIDLSKGGEPEVVRQGRGDLSVLGLG